jgi:hypothetical protein
MTDAPWPKKWLFDIEAMKAIEVNVVEKQGQSSRCYDIDMPSGHSYWVATAGLCDDERTAIVSRRSELQSRVESNRLVISKLESEIEKILRLLSDNNIPPKE